MYFYSFRDFASTETIDTSALATKKERLDNLDQANAEIEKLRKLGEKLTGELQGELYFIYVFLAIILHLKLLGIISRYHSRFFQQLPHQMAA